MRRNIVTLVFALFLFGCPKPPGSVNIEPSIEKAGATIATCVDANKNPIVVNVSYDFPNQKVVFSWLGYSNVSYSGKITSLNSSAEKVISPTTSSTQISLSELNLVFPPPNSGLTFQLQVSTNKGIYCKAQSDTFSFCNNNGAISTSNTCQCPDGKLFDPLSQLCKSLCPSDATEGTRNNFAPNCDCPTGKVYIGTNACVNSCPPNSMKRDNPAPSCTCISGYRYAYDLNLNINECQKLCPDNTTVYTNHTCPCGPGTRWDDSSFSCVQFCADSDKCLSGTSCIPLVPSTTCFQSGQTTFQRTRTMSRDSITSNCGYNTDGIDPALCMNCDIDSTTGQPFARPNYIYTTLVNIDFMRTVNYALRYDSPNTTYKSVSMDTANCLICKFNCRELSFFNPAICSIYTKTSPALPVLPDGCISGHSIYTN